MSEMCSGQEDTTDGWQGSEQLREENGEKVAYERIRYKKRPAIKSIKQPIINNQEWYMGVTRTSAYYF